MQTYTTVQGDTWDIIAMKVYGDELRMTDLLQARENIALIDYQVFPAGIVVYTPTVYYDLDVESLPEWRIE